MPPEQPLCFGAYRLAGPRGPLLRMVSLVRGELQKAHELGEHLLRLGQHAADPSVLLEAHYALGVTGFWRGEMAHARTHLEQSLTLCTSQHARFQSFAGGTVQRLVHRGL